MTFALITLLAALSLAAVADWFSIIGFMTIYAASPIHALIMGIVLALAKLVTTSWVYRNWKFVGWNLKGPLIGFVIALMIATSIGTYGFLTKSHLDQAGGTIDNGAKVERLDQQIAREKSVIIDDEKVITQLDNTINSYIGKDRTDKSLAVRKSQAPQRKQLREDIDASQKRIDTFSDEKLKLQSEVRKQQLDVGPIRYIAELFYGVADDATKNIEAAVRIFTLLITSTLDPLAVILLVAANHTLLRLRDEKKKYDSEEIDGVPKSGSIVADVPIKVDKEAAQDIKSPAKTSTNTEIQKVINEEENTPKEDVQPGSDKLPVEHGRVATVDEESRQDSKESVPPTEQVSIISPMERPMVRERAEEDAISISILPEVVVSLNEKEDTILETDALVSVSPLPIIRSPNLTRISIRQNTLGSDEESAEEEPIHENIQLAVSEVAQHFIPQKINEEEKHTQIEPQETDNTANNVQASQTRTPEVEEILENGQKTDTVEAEIQSAHKDDRSDPPAAKYPTALSWLAEFKRSQNG